MKTISDYVNDEQEVLTVDNYSEMDAAVFAQLSYFRFEQEGYTQDDNFQISIKDYANKILDNPSAYIQKPALSNDERALLEALADSERYENCMMSNFEDQNSLPVNGEILDSQWAAYTVQIDENNSVVAFRGTDGTTRGWLEDAELMFDPDGTNAQILSAEYLKQVDATNIYMTGHSKGGNDAIAGYMMSDQDIRDSIVKIDNFEGPGVNEWFRDNFIEGYNELGGKLNSYYPQDTVIGRALIDKEGNTTYIYSEVRPTFEDKWILGEHDLFSFVIGEDGTFIETDPSFVSDLINTTLDVTVSNLSMAEREKVYGMIERFGICSLIAKQDDNPYADNSGKIKAALDEIDKWGFLSETTKGKLSEKLVGIVSVYEAINIFKNSSEKEKQALQKILGLVVASVCVKMADGVIDKLNDATNIVKQGIDDICDYISAQLAQFRDDVIEKLCEIKDGIFGELENIVDTIADHLKECYDSVADKVEAVLGKGNHMFSININAIKAEIVNMRGSVKNLTVQIQRLSDVKSQLDKEKYGVHMATLATLVSNLEKERNSYDQMITTLDKIVDIYSATEKKLCAQ